MNIRCQMIDWPQAGCARHSLSIFRSLSHNYHQKPYCNWQLKKFVSTFDPTRSIPTERFVKHKTENKTTACINAMAYIKIQQIPVEPPRNVLTWSQSKCEMRETPHVWCILISHTKSIFSIYLWKLLWKNSNDLANI